MGLRVDIYRGEGDFSNGGVSSRAKQLVLMNVEGPSQPSEEAPAAILIDGNVPGTARVVPAMQCGEAWLEVREHAVGPMMGGCYVATPDSRFSRAVEAITGARFYGAVPLHDRSESRELYEQMSR